MTQTPPFDPTMFGGNEDVPPQPATVAWEALNANDYRTTLEALGQWLQWLVPTYRVPPSVIPPCWFLHPGLIEELGHLWTGWQVTRHPESGVGMIGLDWDNHRERSTARLRELVGTAGCNGTSHSAKPDPKLNRDKPLWQEHLAREIEQRTNAFIRAGATVAVTELLQNAESREDQEHSDLSDDAGAPRRPTAPEPFNEQTIQLAIRRADSARRHAQEAAQRTAAEVDLGKARDEVVTQIVVGNGHDMQDATSAWLDMIRGEEHRHRHQPLRLAQYRSQALLLDGCADWRRYPPIDRLCSSRLGPIARDSRAAGIPEEHAE